MALMSKKPKKQQMQTTMEKAPKQLRKTQGGKERFVMLLGDEGAILVLMQGRAVMRRLFAPDPSKESMAPLVDAMEKRPNASLSVVIDLMDQSYVRHTLPPVSALSVNKLVTRRLERDFSPEDITGSIPLGREKTGRKDWNFLLIALSNTPILQQWFKLLLELPNKFTGVYLTPVEMQNYIGQLGEALPQNKEKGESQWQLMVSHHKVGGFRQVVLRDGRLVFTRLTVADSAGVPEVRAGNIEQEVLNTIEYLRRLSYNEGAGLDVYIVVNADIKDLIDVSKFNARNVHRLLPSDVADALNLPQAALTGDQFGDVVLLSAFANSKKPVLKLMPQYASKLNTLYSAQLGVRGLAALVTVGLIGYSVMSYLDKMSAESEMPSLNSKKSQAELELKDVQERVAKLGTDEHMRNAVAAVVTADKPYVFMPLTFVKRMVPLIRPEVRVASLSWTKFGGGNSGGNNNFGGNNSGSQLPEQVEVTFETDGHSMQPEAFLLMANNFTNDLKEVFADYNIERAFFSSKLEDKSDENLSLESNEIEEVLGEEEDDILVTFDGPKADSGNNGQIDFTLDVLEGGAQ